MTHAKTLYLVDGTALAYRAYFALIKRPLMNSRGENTSACFGFTNILLSLLNREKPEHLAIVFDAEGPTFRHELYEEYKATRERMPDDLYAQIPIIKNLTEAMGITVLAESGVEADDIIGSLAAQLSSSEVQVQIISSDKDFAQCVDDNVIIRDPGRGGKGVKLLAAADIFEKHGVRPDQFIDYLALVGDSSDNVPGVPKIGPKTATKLLEKHGSLDGLYEAIEEQTKTMRARLEEHKDSAYLSKALVTIRTDLPLELGLEDLEVKPFDLEALEPILRDLEFHKLLQQLTSSGPTTSQEPRDIRYELLKTDEALQELCARIKAEGRVTLAALHTYDNRTQECFGLAFSLKAGEAFYLPLSANAPIPEYLAMTWLKPILEDPEIRKRGHDLKEAWIALDIRGVELKGLDFDTMLASYLLNATLPKHDLDVLASQYLNATKLNPKDFLGTGKKKKTWGELFFEEQLPFICEEVDLAHQLTGMLEPALEEEGMEALFSDLEMPLIPVLGRMERRGVALNDILLRDMADEMNHECDELLVQIKEWADNPNFNVRSSVQVGELLFEHMKLHEILNVTLRKNRKSGNYSTDSETLEALSEHELPRLILAYRSKQKLLSTYIEAIPNLSVKDPEGILRIHTRFKQTGTVTGRLSSFSPNLQNIPVRTEQGRQIRKAFVPGPPGWVLLAADYSQIELRILAHVSGDPEMLQAFTEGTDIHTRTASLIFNTFPGLITTEQRSAAKATNFGLIYGIGPQSLAKQIDVTVEEAEDFMRAYFESYPKVREYLSNSLADAKKNKYVETLTGRKRQLYDTLESEDGRTRKHAQNIATNTPIQGTAADLIKKAMLRVDKRLREGGFETKMLLQVHDELLFEAPSQEVEAVSAMILEEMTGAFKLDVPLVVEIGQGENWSEAH